MVAPKNFHCAPWGEIENVVDSQNRTIFKTVTINWSKPVAWKKGESAPIGDKQQKTCVYCLLRNHGKQKAKDRIAYVGLTRNLKGRFSNHPKADELRDKRGETSLCVGEVDFGSYWRNTGTGLALEQLEHLLIWAVRPDENDRKTYQLPGMGKNGSKPWRVLNTGFRFHGVMPLQIVYPWMLLKVGRNRSAK